VVRRLADSLIRIALKAAEEACRQCHNRYGKEGARVD